MSSFEVSSWGYGFVRTFLVLASFVLYFHHFLWDVAVNQDLSLPKVYAGLWGAIFTCVGVLMIAFHLPNPYDLHRVCYYMGFYMLGWLIAQQGVTRIKSHYGLGFSLLLLMVVFSCANNTVKFYPLLAIFMAVVGIGFSWLFMEVIQKIRFCKRILEFIGQHTMTIFIWHVLAFKMIEYGLSIISPKETMTLGWGGSYATHSLPLIMIYTLGGILLPLGIVQIKNKILD